MDKDLAQDLAKNLEASKKGVLSDTQIKALSDFIIRTDMRDLYRLNPLVQSLTQPKGEPSPDAILTSHILAERITPWVELVRTELFGSPSPPFSEFKDAEAWLRQEERAYFDGKRAAVHGFNSDEWAEAIKHWMAAFPGYPCTIPQDGFLRYATFKDYDLTSPSFEAYRDTQLLITEPPPNDWVQANGRDDVARYAEPPNWLDNETRIMARATGFTQTSLIKFVLTGVEPTLARYRADIAGAIQELPSGEGAERTWFRFETSSRDLTFDELRSIYKDYRQYVSIGNRGRKLNEKHQQVYELVRQCDGPLEGFGSVAVWKSVQSKWNASHPHDRFTTWKGIKKAYEAVRKTLERRIAAPRGERT